jgi:hypothetical protein
VVASVILHGFAQGQVVVPAETAGVRRVGRGFGLCFMMLLRDARTTQTIFVVHGNLLIATSCKTGLLLYLNLPEQDSNQFFV